MTTLQFKTNSERTCRSSDLGGSVIPKILPRNKHPGKWSVCQSKFGYRPSTLGNKIELVR